MQISARPRRVRLRFGGILTGCRCVDQLSAQGAAQIEHVRLLTRASGFETRRFGRVGGARLS